MKNGYQVDEQTIPEWYERIAAKVEVNVKLTFARVNLFRIEYEKIRQSAWADYEKIEQSALADYKKIRQSARADYEKIRQPALAEYVSRCEKIIGYGKKHNPENQV